jgi:hypothetical protein
MNGSGGWRIVEQNAERGAVEIVELTGAQGPDEGGKAEKPQEQGRGDQIEERIHSALHAGLRCSRKAFKITMREEDDIATAAISGVTSPADANGTATIL